MIIYIKYCDNRLFLDQFPDRFFNFLYTDPPYNTKTKNKSHKDTFQKTDYITWLSNILLLYRTKVAFYNVSFLSLGRTTFSNLVRIVSNGILHTDLPQKLLLWETTKPPITAYSNCFEYIITWITRKEIRVGKVRTKFSGAFTKHIKEVIQQWKNLQIPLYSMSKLRNYSCVYNGQKYIGFNCTQQLLDQLIKDNKIRDKNNNLWGLLETVKYKKMSMIISKKECNYIQARNYQLKYLNNDTNLYFQFAKPYQLIFNLLYFHLHPEFQNVCDLFCGTGSTGDAVVRINKELNLKLNCYLCDINKNLKPHHIKRFTYLFTLLNITNWNLKETDDELIFEYTL